MCQLIDHRRRSTKDKTYQGCVSFAVVNRVVSAYGMFGVCDASKFILYFATKSAQDILLLEKLQHDRDKYEWLDVHFVTEEKVCLSLSSS